MKYKNAGVFCDSPGGADKYLVNITLTHPSARELKFSTKVDKYLSWLLRKSSSNEAEKKPEQEAKERQLFRLTLDYRNLNRATLNDTTISLPTF